jgi:hypothetical protein
MKTLFTAVFVALAVVAGWLEVNQPGTVRNFAGNAVHFGSK